MSEEDRDERGKVCILCIYLQFDVGLDGDSLCEEDWGRDERKMEFRIPVDACNLQLVYTQI